MPESEPPAEEVADTAAADTEAAVADDAPTAEVAPEPEAEPAPVDTAPPAPKDAVRDGIVADLRERLGDAVEDSVVAGGDIWIRVNPAGWRDAAEACKAMGFSYFCFLSGIDWQPNPSLSGRAVWDVEGDAAAEEDEAGELETGVAGGSSRFQVFARLYSVARHIGITLKADLDADQPSVASWCSVFAGADWHEREAWEMYGFYFVGHPGLRHLYLPSDFEGYPLRKDFPLLAREVKPWPGLVDKEPIPGEEGDGEEGTDAPGEESA